MLPTYPTWRANFIIKFNLNAKKNNKSEETKAVEIITVPPQEKTVIQKEEKIIYRKEDKNVFEKIDEEKQKLEAAELELDNIIKQRQRMDEILNRLKKALEIKEDSNKNKGDK